MQAGQTYIQYAALASNGPIHTRPLALQDLLGRIPNPHSRHALAVPQHAPGPRSDARSQRAPPGEIMHRSAAPHPAAAPAAKRSAPPAHPRSDRPAASRTHAAHTHTAQIRHPAAHAGSCATPAAPHDQPPDSTKARPTIKPDRLFLLHDGTGHRPADAIRSRPGDTLQNPRQPAAQSARLPLWASCRMLPGLSGLHPVP